MFIHGGPGGGTDPKVNSDILGISARPSVDLSHLIFLPYHSTPVLHCTALLRPPYTTSLYFITPHTTLIKASSPSLPPPPHTHTHTQMARYFDPTRYHIILVDQRGCGKSKPFASLEDNTTYDSVRDFEKIRVMLSTYCLVLSVASFKCVCDDMCVYIRDIMRACVCVRVRQ